MRRIINWKLPGIARSRRTLNLGAASLIVTTLGLLFSCDLGGMQTNLREFVTTALSVVSLRSITFEAGSAVLSRVPSGVEIVGSILIANPQGLDVTYSLSWNMDDGCFSTLPEKSPTPSSPTNLAFRFTLSPTAEHKTIVFTLAKYASSINKVYENDTFSFTCDSPPDPALGIAAAEDPGARAFLAFVLPTGACNGDLAAIELSWRRILGGGVISATYPVSALGILPPWYPNGDGSSQNRYFAPDTDPGYAYSFTVVLVDSAGQRSSAATAASLPHAYSLVYDGNGQDDGELPAAATYCVEDLVTVAGCGNLSKTGYAFICWNSRADGLGTNYKSGNSFAMGAADLALYALWAQNATIVSFDIGTQALSFSLSSATIARGGTLVANCGNATLASGGSDWRWYVDGVRDSSQTGPSFMWATAGLQPGQYEIGCTLTYNGISYSGSFRATLVY